MGAEPVLLCGRGAIGNNVADIAHKQIVYHSWRNQAKVLFRVREAFLLRSEELHWMQTKFHQNFVSGLKVGNSLMAI
jgi:hypothetical protein